MVSYSASDPPGGWLGMMLRTSVADRCMDNEFGLDLREIIKKFENAEVLSVYFPLLAKTLVIDMRSDDESEPLVRIVPMVNSVEERFRSLRRMRPRFRRPESITLVPWPKYVDA